MQSGKGCLRIQIDRKDTVSFESQALCKMSGCCRFPTAAFEVHNRDNLKLVTGTTPGKVGSRFLRIYLKSVANLPDIIQGISPVAARGGFDLRDLSFSMKLAKVGMIDAKQLGGLAAGKAAHDFFSVGREVGSALRMKIGRKKLCVVSYGNVQVLLSFAHLCLDSWARFLSDRALFIETIA